MIVPTKSPDNHSKKYKRPWPSPVWIVLTKAKDNAIMEFMHQWDEGAYFRAVWTKTTINIQPESQLSMKVVLGFEMRSMKKIRINEPKAQLPTTLKQPTTSLVNGSKASALKSSMSQQQIMATNAPRNCARQQTGSMFHLNLFYFLRQLHKVTAGLRFAPLTGPHMTTPTSTPSPTLTSANLAVLTDNATTTNNIIPINSQKNIFNLGSSLIWLYCQWIQLYRTDCFNDVA